MKKFSTMFALFVALVSVCVLTTSCDKEKNDPVIPAAKRIAGSYQGDIKCTVMKNVVTFDNVTFTLTAPTEATVDMTIGAFGNPPMAVPAITIKGVKVTGTDDSYTLQDTSFSGTTDAGKQYSGTVKGTVVKGKLTAQFNLKYGAMPMPLICEYTGTVKK